MFFRGRALTGKAGAETQQTEPNSEASTADCQVRQEAPSAKASFLPSLDVNLGLATIHVLGLTRELSVVVVVVNFDLELATDSQEAAKIAPRAPT